ncbi:MAG: VWA domain-containing protein, partial [Elusimicrobia bacterium]|nr:VWA domain-containing protein [Elusimicrobiota bacterium]
MEFSFLHPSFLWALPVAAGPVLLHWLTRPRPRPMPFSSLELLREAVRSRLARSRLTQILLMALRCLLLAVLMLLFSRPILHWAGGAAMLNGSVTAVLLLDASYSMDARQAGLSSLEWARDQAKAVLEKAQQNDRFGLVVFSNRVELSLPPTEDLEKINKALDSLSVTARPTDVGPALDLAYQMLETESGNQEAVLLFSDFAENGWKRVLTRSRTGSSVRFDPQIRVLLVEAGEKEPNGEIVSIQSGVFEHRLWGDSSSRDKSWTLFLEGRSAAQGRVRLANEPQRQPISISERGSFSWGQVSLEPDALAWDDSRFFLMQRPAPFSVLVVNGAPALSPVQDETYYLSAVLEDLAGIGVRSQTIPAERMEDEDLSRWEVVALLNVSSLSPAIFSSLESFVKKGGGLWVTAGHNVSPPSWSGLLPGRWGPVEDKSESMRLTPEAGRHGLGRDLGEDGGFEWNQVQIRKIMSFVPSPGAVPLLMTSESGRPVLVVSRFLKGHVAVWTTTVDRDWTNFPSKPLYP